MKTKKLGLIVPFVVAASALVACNGGTDSSTGGRSKSTQAKTLVYLTSADSESYNTILKKVIADFNAIIEPEGYKIETKTPGTDYYTALNNFMSANQAPDIFMMEEGYFNGFKKLLLNLDPYLSASTSLSSDDLWSLNDFYKNDNGELCCLIKDFSPDFMLIYNKTMLDEYNQSHPEHTFTVSETEPMSWTEYYEMCSTIQKEMSVSYGSSLGFEGVKHLHELVQSTGKSMYSSDYKNINKDVQDVKDAFSFFCALQKDNAQEFSTYWNLNQFKDNGGKAPASYTSGSTTSEQTLFKQGKCFSIFNGLYAFSGYDFYNTSFEYGIAPHPVKDKTKGAFGTTSAMVSHAVYKKTKYPDIAWRFLEYYQTEGLKQFAKIAYNIPGNKTIAGSDDFLVNEDPKVQKMANYFYNFVTNSNVTWTEYNNLISYSAVEQCFNTQFAKYYSASGGLDFDNLLIEIDKSINNKAR